MLKLGFKELLNVGLYLASSFGFDIGAHGLKDRCWNWFLWPGRSRLWRWWHCWTIWHWGAVWSARVHCCRANLLMIVWMMVISGKTGTTKCTELLLVSWKIFFSRFCWLLSKKLHKFTGHSLWANYIEKISVKMNLTFWCLCQYKERSLEWFRTVCLTLKY